MSAPDAVAKALALGFLAGPWSRAGLVQRATQVLGEQPRWLVPLVRHLHARFPDAPNDACESLSQTIQRAASFKRGHAPGQPGSKLVRLLVAEPSMGRRRWPVPTLTTSADVASWLELTPAELDWFADARGLNAEVGVGALHHYAFRWLPKRRGGYRLVEAPKSRLKALQRRVLHEILDQVPAHAAAHGFIRGRSTLTCARAHAGRSVVLRMDLEEFFPSIGAARVYRIFRGFGYPETVARVLTGLCTLRVATSVLGSMPRPSFAEQHDAAALATRARTRRRLRHRHLPQGAPTSPALANLASYPMDARLAGAARAVGANYTRYADDLAFSGDAELSRRAQRLEALIAAIAIEEGFQVNHRKTRLMHQGQAQQLVGLVTNQRPNVPRAARERLEAILTNVLKCGLETQNREQNPLFLESLRGRVAWVEHVNPAHAQKLRRLLAACEAAGVPTARDII
jgi:RNA-directed DNA polymerase